MFFNLDAFARTARVFRVLLVAVVCFSVCSTARASGGEESRRRLDLNGTWEFRMDPQDEGLVQEWFRGKVVYPDKIQVPGNWQAQGFGEPRRHLRHDYQGMAWYRRTVQVPSDWSGKRIWLHLGGVANTAEVFVNGSRVGSVDGFLTPYEFDVTDAAAPGATALIACRVNSGGPAPVGMFNFWGRWGGLYRPVWIEARPDPAIDDLFVMPDVKNATARTQVVLRRTVPGPGWQGQLRVSIAPGNGGQVSQAEGTVHIGEGKTESDPTIVEVRVGDVHPWSPEDPFLYDAKVSLLTGDELIDTLGDRFGMRQFEAGENGELLLNGRPYFVRGIGDDCVEVLTGTAVPDKQVYLDRIRLCKRYGYNGFRYLSHTPAKEIFEAADEAGFLIMAEGEIYWKPKEMIPLLKRQVQRIAKANRNHPSWYIWSSGNELMKCEGPTPDPEWMDYIQHAHDTFRRLDPTRFFVASDGVDVFPTDIVTQKAKFAATAPLYDQPFDGAVDEVAYFRRVLSEAEMARLADDAADYAQRVRSLEPSGYWRLDETALGKVADASGGGNHGVMEAGVAENDLGEPGALSPEDPNPAMRSGAGGRSVSLREVAPATFAAKNQPFSVSLWIKPNGFRKNDWGTPFSYGAAADGCAFLISLYGKEGDGRLIVGRFRVNLPASESRLVARQWNHVGVTHDGSVMRMFVNGKPDRTIPVKLSTVLADGRIGNLIRAGRPDMSRYKKLPHIWHEFPNTYVGPLHDLTIDEKYTGVFRDDDCIARYRRQIADYGLTERYPQIRGRSLDLFYFYLKHHYESARSSPTLDGYGYWLLTDIPGGVEGDHGTLGMFSTVYEPEKYPDPGPILRFNRETVLFTGAEPNGRVLGAGEEKRVSVGISHYGREPIRDGRLCWQVETDGSEQAAGVVDLPTVEIGDVKEIAAVELGPYDFGRAEKLTLSVRLESEACRQENAWDFWTFPARKTDFAGRGIANLTGVEELSVRYAVEAHPLEQASVVIASQLTGEVLQYLSDGGAVVLLSESGTLARPLRFTYWAEWIRQVGNFVEMHPAMSEFPHDGFCSFQFFRLFRLGLEAVDLTEAKFAERHKLAPIVWGLKTDYDPAMGLRWSDPGNRWKLYRAGLVCEGRVGSGRLVVCSLKVLEGTRRRYPEAGYLLDCLVDYALGDQFSPAPPPITEEEVRDVFSTTAKATR